MTGEAKPQTSSDINLFIRGKINPGDLFLVKWGLGPFVFFYDSDTGDPNIDRKISPAITEGDTLLFLGSSSGHNVRSYFLSSKLNKVVYMLRRALDEGVIGLVDTKMIPK